MGYWLCIAILLEGAYSAIKKRDEAAQATRESLERERDNLATQLAQERDRSRPKFVGEITKCTAAPESGGIVAHVEIAIGNQFAPSIATDWALEIIAEGKTYSGELYSPGKSGTVTLSDGVGKPRAQFSGADFIYEKTSRPVAPGAREVGWLGAHFRGITREQAMGEGSEWVVSFADLWNARWVVRYKIHGPATGSGRLTYTPGGVVPLA